MSLVLDSTVLMYLAKIRILDKLARAQEGIIPSSVYEEVVVGGKKKGKDDALLVERLVKEGLLKVASAKGKAFLGSLLEIQAISYVDSETLAIAKELGAVAVIDETASRALAELHGISFHGSVFLLFLLFTKKTIQKGEIKLYVDKMIELGWRCSTEFYSAILEEIDKL